MPVRCGPFILSVVGAPYGEGIGGHHIIRITEVVQRAKALAAEQLVRLSVTKLLSNLGAAAVQL